MFTSMFPILSTPDLPRALGFYRDLLDGTVTYRFPAEGEPGYVGMELGSSHLGIGYDPDAKDGPAGQRVTIWTYAEDCDEAVDRLRAAGVRIIEEPVDQPWGERVARVHDPDGNEVIIGSRPAGSDSVQDQDLGAVARAIIDTNMYMTLGTGDETGRPWVSPVYFATAGYSEFYWVSSPEVRHSRNIAARPQISIVVFDSRAPVGTGQAVYMSAVAEEVTDAGIDRGIDIFSRGSEARGARAWTPDSVRPPAPYRLYRATASEHWVVDPAASPNQRTPVTLERGGPD